MASPQQQHDSDSDDDITDPLKLLMPESTEEEDPKQEEDHQQQHYLSSIDSALFIRQLPSQGLSFQLWPAATTLLSQLDLYRRDPTTSALSSSFSRRSVKVLELGSGTGLVGIAAAAILGAEVTVTDLPHVIPNLQFNVDANAEVLAKQGGKVHVAALRWGEDADVERVGREFDVVLASDVVYYDHLYEPLLKTLRLIMREDGITDGCEKQPMQKVFIMAHLKRWKKESQFFNKAKKFFNVDVIHTDPPLLDSRKRVVVYRFVNGKKAIKPKAS